MVIARALLAALLAVTACNYSPGFADCVIACSASGECPDGLTCIDRLCRTGTSEAACTTATADSGIPESGDAGTDGGDVGLDADDASVPIDATHMVILSQNTSLVSVNGGLVYCAIDAGEMKTNRWWRVFDLADAAYGISGPTLHVTDVLFASEAQLQGTVVTVKLESYTGTYDATTLDTSSSQLHELVKVDVPAADSGAHDWTVPINADIATNTLLAVEITSEDQRDAAGGFVKQFHLANNSAGQTHKSYHGGDCVTAGSVTRHLILRVQGTF